MDPNAAFAELGSIRLADVDVDELLDRIAQLAKRTIPGASEVSVTLLQGDSAHTAAFTGDLALKLDEAQYERGRGPCLVASPGIASVSVPPTPLARLDGPTGPATRSRPARAAPCPSACRCTSRSPAR